MSSQLSVFACNMYVTNEHTAMDTMKHNYNQLTMISRQTTLRGPMDPAQHSDGCESETEND